MIDESIFLLQPNFKKDLDFLFSALVSELEKRRCKKREHSFFSFSIRCVVVHNATTLIRAGEDAPLVRNAFHGSAFSRTILDSFPKTKMKNLKKWIVAATACAAVFTACDKDDEAETNDADREFIRGASVSNNAEVMAGQLAVSKGNTPMVRAYGQSMVSEHTPAQADLRSRASAAGITVVDTVDAENRAAMSRLTALSGYSFDTAYINQQIKGHAKTVGIFNTEISNGENENIKGYAQQNLPHIQHHLERADSIRRAL